MTGYHVYFKNKDVDEYNEIDLLTNLISCLSWKKYYGPIKLFCNQEFLDYIKEYNLDQIYDEINIDISSIIPYKEYLDKYWSFNKIHVAKFISQTEDRFVILDNDFYISNYHQFNWDLNFLGYHFEAYNINSSDNVYLDPKIFLDEENYNKLNWGMPPINCAFMYLNSKNLIDTWYNWVLGIIETNKDKPKNNFSSDTIFIEQRLLPTLCDALGLTYETILPNYYLQYIPFNEEGHEWFPLIDSHPKYRELFNNFRHIWGMKKFYSNEKWRKKITNIQLEDLKIYHNYTDVLTNFPKIILACEDYAK
jgi:hypothetical protein